MWFHWRLPVAAQYCGVSIFHSQQLESEASMEQIAFYDTIASTRDNSLRTANEDLANGLRRGTVK